MRDNQDYSLKVIKKLFPEIFRSLKYYKAQNTPMFDTLFRGSYKPEVKVYFSRNFNGKVTLSSTDNHGNILVTDEEIKSIINKELMKDDLNLNTLITNLTEMFDAKIGK